VHEYSIVQSLMEHVEAQARAHHATAVREVTVRIGELSGVEPELLVTAFELLRERTICDGAPLRVTPVPARWACRRCERPVPPGAALRCAECGVPAHLVEGGEILLDRIELEVADV
jgi:hydrogenase nickel incorporation protein HypA/HybF